MIQAKSFKLIESVIYSYKAKGLGFGLWNIKYRGQQPAESTGGNKKKHMPT